jgi:hypothetical protein
MAELRGPSGRWKSSDVRLEVPIPGRLRNVIERIARLRGMPSAAIITDALTGFDATDVEGGKQ